MFVYILINVIVYLTTLLKDLKKLIKWVDKNNPISKEQTLFILEYTGIYSEEIALFFTRNDILFSLIS